MEKYIYDKNNGLWYELQGDYYIHCVVLDEQDTQTIDMWGRKHLGCIKAQRRVLYTTLLLSGKLNSCIAEIDNEQLKAQDQMAWVGAMNNICNAAEEIVNAEVIFA